MEFSGLRVGLPRLTRLLPIFVGALGGFAYYFFIGCTTGSCPITSNPSLSTAYGGLVGAVLVFGGGSKSRKTE